MKWKRLAFLNLIFIFFWNCADEQVKKDEDHLPLKEAFVIGFDQCALGAGRILAIVEPPDTVITYNFPDSLYTFPDSLFSNYLNDCLFPGGTLERYPVSVKYRAATPTEFTGFICHPDFIMATHFHQIGSKQVIVVSVVK